MTVVLRHWGSVWLGRVLSQGRSAWRAGWTKSPEEASVDSRVGDSSKHSRCLTVGTRSDSLALEGYMNLCGCRSVRVSLHTLSK